MIEVVFNVLRDVVDARTCSVRFRTQVVIVRSLITESRVLWKCLTWVECFNSNSALFGSRSSGILGSGILFPTLGDFDVTAEVVDVISFDYEVLVVFTSTCPKSVDSSRRAFRIGSRGLLSNSTISDAACRR